MSAMTDGFETALLALLFNNTALTNVGDSSGLVATSTAGSTQLALATVAYIDADTLLTADECDYTSYSRPTQPRSGSGWTVSGDAVSNAALIQFGEMSGGASDTAVHLGLGFIATGDVLRLHADLNSDLVINVGVNPQFSIGSLDWTAS